MIVVLYGLAALALMIFWGLGATLLLVPPRLQRYSLILAPQLGYCLMTLASWVLYARGEGGTDRYLAILHLLPLLLLVVGLRRGRWRILSDCLSPALMGAYAVSLLGFVIMEYPVLADRTLTAFTIGGDDIVFYAWGSRFLKEFSPMAPGGLFAQFDITYHINSRFGIYFLTAAVSGALGLQPYQVVNLCSALLFTTSVGTCYAVAREVFDYSHRGAMALSVLYVFSPMMTYVVQNGFYPQMVAGSLSLCLVLVVWEKMHPDADLLLTLGLGVLLSWGILSTYPHMLPLTWLPLLAWILLSRRQPAANAAWVGGVLFLSLLLSTDKIGMLAYEFVRSTDWPCPWRIAIVMPYKLFSFVFDRNPHAWRDVLISVPLVVFFWRGLSTLRREHRNTFLAVAALSLSIILGYLCISVQNLHLPSPAGGYLGGYRAWKVGSYFLPQVLLGLFAPFGRISDQATPSLSQGRVFALFIMYELLSVCSGIHGVVKVTPDLVQLSQVEAQPGLEAINMLDPNGKDEWRLMWEGYFLARKSLNFRYTAYAANPAALTAPWSLQASTDHPTPMPPASQRIIINPTYHLVRNPPPEEPTP